MIEFVNGETVDLFSALELWEIGVFIDADNTFDELSFSLTADENAISIDWDGSATSNPILAAVPGFYGSTQIQFCVSDFEETICASNTVLVYETAPPNQMQISADLFVEPENTGHNMTFGVNSSQMDAYAGDTLGIFYDFDTDGELECIGMYEIVEGFFGFPIWGDDSSTDEVEGLLPGQVPTFAILSDGEVEVISPYPNFETYSDNGIHYLENFYKPIEYTLTAGWNMVGYVGSAQNNGIVNQINNSLTSGALIEETFQVIKNVSGQFWSPQFAQINEFTQGEGYMMYVSGEPSGLNFQSPSAYQHGIEYPLSAGWNMVAYTGDAFADNSIVSSVNGALGDGLQIEETFQVIKNVSGQFWSAQFAQINSFVPGEAYMMYNLVPSSLNFQRDPYIGMHAHGGIVFYVDETGKHGLVAAEEDLPELYPWGCVGNVIDGADGLSIGSGLQNTLDIVSDCDESPIAASIALSFEQHGYSDWYLPSFDELMEMFTTIGNAGEKGNVGLFKDEWYISSTEFENDPTNVWGNSFSESFPNAGGGHKGNLSNIRLIRNF